MPRRSTCEIILDLIDRALAANDEWRQQKPEPSEDEDDLRRAG